MPSPGSRRLLGSSKSSYITSLSDTLGASIIGSLRLEELPEDVGTSNTDTSHIKKVSDLGRMLSMKSVISIASSFAEQQQAASKSAKYKLSKIGAGTCGTIFAEAGSDIVFKMAKHNTDALTGDLFNDFKMHISILSAIQSIANGIDFPRVPRTYAYIPGSKAAWWDENQAFSAAARDNDFETPCNTLCSERIVPLSLAIRSRLIDNFCPERLREHAHQDPSNKDCLVRVYLGARKPPDGPRRMFFSLRNYKLHLNQMLELGIDVKALAYAIAGALAVMHWKACIDAKDVEFVLGSSSEATIPALPQLNFDHITRDTYVGPKSLNIMDSHQRTIDLWLLDFNLCSTITMDDAGVAMAVKAWKVNDPYYPKPLQDYAIDRKLWNVFVSRYIEISDQLLQQKPGLAGLPRKFIAGIIQVQRERKEGI